jgi:hypothetical protein
MPRSRRASATVPLGSNARLAMAATGAARTKSPSSISAGALPFLLFSELCSYLLKLCICPSFVKTTEGTAIPQRLKLCICQ